MWRFQISVKNKMLVFSGLWFWVLLHLTKSSLVKEASSVDTFKQCLISTPTSFGYCLGMGALSKLQNIDNDPEFDVVDGVTFARDEQQVREASNFLDRDPGDFRTIMDSLGQVFSQRSLKWDMSMLYPGLAMRVAPSVTPGGVLEFVMDPHREALSQYNVKEAGTGRLLAKTFLIPLLLGFKFKVTTLIPIIFGIIAIIAKKFILLSKIGLLISSTFGLGSLIFGHKDPHGGGFSPGFGGGGGGGGYGEHFGGGGGYGTYTKYPSEDEQYYRDGAFRDNSNANIPSTFHDENNVRLFNDVQTYPREDTSGSGRNFAWNEAEKKAKT